MEIYFAGGPEQVPPIARELHGITEWRAEQILERERRLLAMIQCLWHIETVRCDDQQRTASARPSERALRLPDKAGTDELS